jgi:integrase
MTWGLLEGFTRWQEAEGYSQSSIARALSTVRGYARLASQAGALSPDTLHILETVKAPRGRAARNRDAGREQTRKGAKKATATPITRAQARALKRDHPDTPQGRRDALIMALLLDHGLRVSELGDLQVTDLDPQAGVMRFYRRKVDRTQTHTLTRDALRAARRYFDAGDAPAAGQLLRAIERRGADTLGGPISVQALRELVGRLGTRIGREGLSPHDCRHAWATWASESGTPIRDLQEAGGWASPAMPLRYAQAATVANERVNLGEEAEQD